MHLQLSDRSLDAVLVKNVLRSAEGDWQSLEPWLREAYERGELVFARDGVSVRGRGPCVRAGLDDLLVRWADGQISRCAPEVFWALE